MYVDSFYSGSKLIEHSRELIKEKRKLGRLSEKNSKILKIKILKNCIFSNRMFLSLSKIPFRLKKKSKNSRKYVI